MTTSSQVSGALAFRLREAGLDAVEAYEREHFRESGGAVVAVRARETKLERAGLTDYLGERYDAALGCMVEVYGLCLQLTAALEVYAPRALGAAGCDAEAERVTEALLTGLPEGLRLEDIAWEASGWDKVYGRFVRRGTARCTAYFTAEADERSAVLTEFILKGVRR